MVPRLRAGCPCGRLALILPCTRPQMEMLGGITQTPLVGRHIDAYVVGSAQRLRQPRSTVLAVMENRYHASNFHVAKFVGNVFDQRACAKLTSLAPRTGSQFPTRHVDTTNFPNAQRSGRAGAKPGISPAVLFGSFGPDTRIGREFRIGNRPGSIEHCPSAP